MKAREFDEAFGAGEEVDAHLDWSKARRPNLNIKRVSVDFPAWMVDGLDREAKRLGVTRQALIKTLIARQLD